MAVISALSLMAAGFPGTASALARVNRGGLDSGAVASAAVQAIMATPSNGWCGDWWRNRVSNVYFYMSGKRLYWDFYLTSYAWDWLGDEVYATMPQAQLNGRAINPPYGPHREVVTYDFHSSILTYHHIGGGGGTIKRGDRLWMFWEFIGSIPGHGAWRAISCKIP